MSTIMLKGRLLAESFNNKIQNLDLFISSYWDNTAVPILSDFIRIPNSSPAFDKLWADNGHTEDAIQLLARSAEVLLGSTPGAQVEIVRLERRTPLLLIDISATAPSLEMLPPVLFYGHLDKQPEGSGWSGGFGAREPVLKDDKLYGRGSVDDGYALLAAIGAILAIDSQKLPRGRCLIVIEASEESGSEDLPYYIDILNDQIGTPGLIICLDSGCGNYEQLWLVTSLRGMTSGRLQVDILTEDVHSGLASGIAASSFRILRTLLSRLEDENTGRILLPELHAKIPPDRAAQTRAAALALGSRVAEAIPFVSGAKPVIEDPVELLLNQTWRPALAITGLEGAPPLPTAGNVLRRSTSAKLSIRLPPTVSAGQAQLSVQKLLEDDPPYGARVTCEMDRAASGWNAPALSPWLMAALETGSQLAFGKGVAMMGRGGSIPIVGLLADMFPTAQFIVTGVQGPGSNAHGPDEFLHLPMVKGVTTAIATVLASQAQCQSEDTQK